MTDTDTTVTEPETPEPATDETRDAFVAAWDAAMSERQTPSGHIAGEPFGAFVATVEPLARRPVKKAATDLFGDAVKTGDAEQIVAASQLRAHVDQLPARQSTASTRDPADVHAERVALLRVAADAAVDEAVAAGIADVADRADAVQGSDSTDQLVKRLARVLAAAPVSSRNTGGTRRDVKRAIADALVLTDSDTLTMTELAGIPTDQYPDGELSPGAASDSIRDRGALDGTGWHVASETGSGIASVARDGS